MQGWRISMEDAHTTVLDLLASNADASKNHPQRLSFFGVFDGHGGDKVALFTGDNIHNIIAKQDTFKAGNYEQALKDGFLATDRAILNGTTFLTFPLREGAHVADKYLYFFADQTPNTRRRFLAAQPVSVSSPTTKSTLFVPPCRFPSDRSQTDLACPTGQCRRFQECSGCQGPREAAVLRPQAPKRRCASARLLTRGRAAPQTYMVF